MAAAFWEIAACRFAVATSLALAACNTPPAPLSPNQSGRAIQPAATPQLSERNLFARSAGTSPEPELHNWRLLGLWGDGQAMQRALLRNPGQQMLVFTLGDGGQQGLWLESLDTQGVVLSNGTASYRLEFDETASRHE